MLTPSGTATGDDAATADVPPPFDSVEEEMLWRITRANRRYLAAYHEHAKLFAVIEQVATFNDELREIRREIRRALRRPGPALDRADAGRRAGPR